MSIRSIIKTALLGTGAVLCRNHKSKLLYYHDVFGDTCYTDMGTPLNLFQQHLDVMGKVGFQIVPRITKDEGEVVLLFDDGFHGIYDVRQFFYDRHIFPTVFLAVELIGKKGYLNKEEILELQSNGFIFECHGWSHQDLTSFNDDELMRELKGSKEMLSELLGKEVTEICLPIGYYSDHLLEQIKKYGYETVYSSVPGNYNELVTGMMRPRHLLQQASPRDVRYILNGGNDLLRRHYIKLHQKA